jgi:hypothetical protein
MQEKVNFNSYATDWSIDVFKYMLENWHNTFGWSPEHPMPTFLITFKKQKDNQIIPEYPYFLDFLNGDLENPIMRNKSAWGSEIKKVLNERPSTFSYVVVSETANKVSIDDIEISGVLVLYVSFDGDIKTNISTFDLQQDNTFTFIKGETTEINPNDPSFGVVRSLLIFPDNETLN